MKLTDEQIKALCERAEKAEQVISSIVDLANDSKSVTFTSDWGNYTLTVQVDGAHTHVGAPESDLDNLIGDLYALLVEGKGLRWVENRDAEELTISKLVEQAHANARKHGFWEDWDLGPCSTNTEIAKMLMLIVSELSEALEALRNRDQANFREELADVAIRLGDLCGGLNINLEAEIKAKMAKNADRSYKHGKAF